MKCSPKFWLKFSLVNLMIVTLLGVLMRYKIGFEFPYFNQKYIQESHYHFAFYGWITHTVMVLMVNCIEKANFNFKSSAYHPIFIANLISCYGMLISFFFLGYDILSQVFSLSAILSTYYFSFRFIRDIKQYDVNPVSAKWFKAALFFNFLSTLGIFALAYMMLTNNLHQNEYLATSYYFLHFQYNGWFFFSCMGLFVDFIRASGSAQLKVFRLFSFSCIPAYLLSVLWLPIPVWLYVIVVLAALSQVYAWLIVSIDLVKHKPKEIFFGPLILRYILLFVAVALSIKLLLQLGSTIPELSKLAFGFRPIVIAYLHLVLLAIITLFLLFYFYASGIFSCGKGSIIGLLIFGVGVFLNEIVLAIQGFAAFSYTMVPYAHEILFAVALILFSGISLLVYFSILRREEKQIL